MKGAPCGMDACFARQRQALGMAAAELSSAVVVYLARCIARRVGMPLRAFRADFFCVAPRMVADCAYDAIRRLLRASD